MVVQATLVSLVSHFIGDYYLQTNKIAAGKSRSYYYTFLHSMLYMIPFIIQILVIGISLQNMIYVIVLGLSHMVIDMLKLFATNEVKKRNKQHIFNSKVIFAIDQTLHFICIYGFSILYQPVESTIQLHQTNLIIVLIVLAFLRPLYITYKMYLPGSPIQGLMDKKQVSDSIKLLLYCMLIWWNWSAGLGLGIVLFIINSNQKIWSYDRLLRSILLCYSVVFIFKAYIYFILMTL